MIAGKRGVVLGISLLMALGGCARHSAEVPAESVEPAAETPQSAVSTVVLSAVEKAKKAKAAAVAQVMEADKAVKLAREIARAEAAEALQAAEAVKAAEAAHAVAVTAMGEATEALKAAEAEEAGRAARAAELAEAASRAKVAAEQKAAAAVEEATRAQALAEQKAAEARAAQDEAKRAAQQVDQQVAAEIVATQNGVVEAAAPAVAPVPSSVPQPEATAPAQPAPAVAAADALLTPPGQSAAVKAPVEEAQDASTPEERYAPSSPVRTSRVDGGDWNGIRNFNNVYCMKFPEPEKALVLMERYYADDTINLVRVSYKGKMMINVISAILPVGEDAAGDMAVQKRYLQESEAISKRSHHLKERQGVFGTVLNSRINNLAPAVKGVPYPLVHSFLPDDSLKSISVSRLFGRGPDRFEIAIYQLAPEDAGPAEEAAMVARLQRLADQTLSDFERCTAGLPVRTSR